jgi:outer membrane protein OmpA-like peptidoglycan-associated protein
LRLLATLCVAVGLVSPSLAWVPRPDVDVITWMVFFDARQVELPPRAMETLRQAAQEANGRYDGPVVVSGHIDKGEGDSSLSSARALFVRDKLVELGVLRERIILGSWGDQQLLVVHEAGISDAQNRRVEIVMERRCKGACPRPPDKFQDAGSG